MRPETLKAMEMMFQAKWNLPKAADYAGLTLKETKLCFAGYVKDKLPTWKNEGI
jgi:hypothetical protein